MKANNDLITPTHLAVPSWINIYNVVTPMIVSTMHKHRMKNIYGGIFGIRSLEVICKIQSLGEFKAIIDLDISVCHGIVLESHELEVQNGG